MVRPGLPALHTRLGGARAMLASGQLTNGRTVQEFEQQAAVRVGVRHCVAASSCASGLALAFPTRSEEGAAERTHAAETKAQRSGPDPFLLNLNARGTVLPIQCCRFSARRGRVGWSIIMHPIARIILST